MIEKRCIMNKPFVLIAISCGHFLEYLGDPYEAHSNYQLQIQYAPCRYKKYQKYISSYRDKRKPWCLVWRHAFGYYTKLTFLFFLWHPFLYLIVSSSILPFACPSDTKYWQSLQKLLHWSREGKWLASRTILAPKNILKNNIC